MSLSISQHDVAMAAQQGMLQSSSGMNGAAVIPANKVIKPTAVIFFNIQTNLRYNKKSVNQLFYLTNLASLRKRSPVAMPCNSKSIISTLVWTTPSRSIRSNPSCLLLSVRDETASAAT